MKKTIEDMCIGFSKMLVQEFLLLRKRAGEKKDETSMRSLDIIIAGITELTQAVEAAGEGRDKILRFSPDAFDIFSNLAKHPNDPHLLRKAGAHYLVEWQLPISARRHFERALNLNLKDEALPMLIEIANLAMKRKIEVAKLTSQLDNNSSFKKKGKSSGH
jgi:hypothetical protein